MVLEGLMWGVVFYFIALMMTFFVFKSYLAWYVNVLPIIILCWLGHFVGTYLYSLIPSDSSLVFFPHAMPHFTSVGTGFVEFITWYVRDFFTEDSYLGTLYFFSSFAFLGSVLWYFLFLICSHSLNIKTQSYYVPAFVLLCWPSYLFYTSGIGKDSLCFFFIPLILLLAIQIQAKKNILLFIILIGSIILMGLIRPYLLLIMAVAAYLSIFKNIKQFSLLRITALIIFIPIIGFILLKVATIQGGLHFLNFTAIENKAFMQQIHQNVGTSFPILSDDPRLVLFCLPYNFVMNLLFPLFLLARNQLGLLASFENLFLLSLIYFFFKRKYLYYQMKNQLPIVKFIFHFFICGMLFMALINTNLGLSMREKSMYVPAFLVLVMLIWLRNKTRTFSK